MVVGAGGDVMPGAARAHKQSRKKKGPEIGLGAGLCPFSSAGYLVWLAVC